MSIENDIERIAAALESVAGSLCKIANPPVVAEVPVISEDTAGTASAASAGALTVTAAAGGATLEAYLATPGWTEQMLIDQGLAIRPSFT